MKKIKTLLGRVDQKSSGFTLLEVIVVLILMGILSAVAIARVSDNTTEERAAADKLKIHLRFAQTQAMNSDTTWGVHSVDGSSYFLYRGGDLNNKARFPGEEDGEVAFHASINTTPIFTLSFDEWGRPYADANPDGNTPVNSNQAIIIGSRTITVTQETGFIP